MAIANDVLMYEDVREALDAALEDPRGIKVECSTKGHAMNFRQRCYKFRKLLKTLAMQNTSEDDPAYGFSPYDALVATVEGPFVVVRKRELIKLKITPLTEADFER